MLLANKTVLITGASRGIGRTCAELFASEGATLVLLSRNTTAVEAYCEALRQNGTTCHVYPCDVRSVESIKATFSQIMSNGIVLDVLLNNAGIMIDATLQMVKEEAVRDIFETNVFGVIYMSQLSIKSFIKKKGGSIINMSSIIGTNGNSGQTIYGASKTAVIGFTKSLSKELAPLNVRVNAIAPGFIDTEMTRGMNPKFYEKNLASIGMKRIGKPEDVARVALFLASDLSSYVTGQIIGVDGGMVI